jgi:hypothetical protein
MIDTDRDAAALGWLVRRIRPAWDEPGVRAALTAALAKHPLPRVAAAAIDAAATPSTRTPAGIADRLRNGWAGSQLDAPPRRDPAEAAPRYDPDARGRAVAQRATPAEVAAALQRARAAIRANREPA